MGVVNEDEDTRVAEGESAPAADRSADDAGQGELLSRLAVIEGQALEERAEAYAHVHDELLRRLESADEPSDS